MMLVFESEDKFRECLEQILKQKFNNYITCKKNRKYYLFSLEYLEYIYLGSCPIGRPVDLHTKTRFFLKELKWNVIRQMKSDEMRIFYLSSLSAFKQKNSLSLIRDINIVPISYLCSFILYNLEEYNFVLKNNLPEKTRNYLEENIVRYLENDTQVLKILVNSRWFQTEYYIPISDFNHDTKMIYFNEKSLPCKGVYKDMIHNFLQKSQFSKQN